MDNNENTNKPTKDELFGDRVPQITCITWLIGSILNVIAAVERLVENGMNAIRLAFLIFFCIAVGFLTATLIAMYGKKKAAAKALATTADEDLEYNEKE